MAAESCLSPGTGIPSDGRWSSPAASLLSGASLLRTPTSSSPRTGLDSWESVRIRKCHGPLIKSFFTGESYPPARHPPIPLAPWSAALAVAVAVELATIIIPTLVRSTPSPTCLSCIPLSSCIRLKRALIHIPLFSRPSPLPLCSSQAALGAPLSSDATSCAFASHTPDQAVIMPSDKAGHRHTYKKSTDNLRSTQTRTSSSGSQTPTPRRRPSTLLRNSSASNTDDKRHAQTTTATTTARPGSSPAPVRPSPSVPAHNPDRDSFHSILEDPFFQGYDPSSVNNLPAEPPRDQHTAGSIAQGNEWEADQRSTRPRRESLTIGSSQASQLWVCPQK